MRDTGTGVETAMIKEFARKLTMKRIKRMERMKRMSAAKLLPACVLCLLLPAACDDIIVPDPVDPEFGTNRFDSRERETALGDMICDGIMWYVNNVNPGRPDRAIARLNADEGGDTSTGDDADNDGGADNGTDDETDNEASGGDEDADDGGGESAEGGDSEDKSTEGEDGEGSGGDSTPASYAADFGVLNGGIFEYGLRKGQITSDMIAGMLKGDALVIITITSKQVCELFEWLASLRLGENAWAQVSEEVRFKIDWSSGIGKVLDLKIKGMPVDPNDENTLYRIVTGEVPVFGKANNHMEHYYPLFYANQHKAVVIDVTVAKAVEEYVASRRQPYQPEIDGRIVVDLAGETVSDAE
jgi:hypothetical protein